MKRILALSVLALAATAQAQVVTIDQAKALAGNVTPGDTAGFPVTIRRGGSYRLTGNLRVADLGVPAIRIETNEGVTLNLGGFRISGSRCGPSRCAVNPPAISGIEGFTTIDIADGVIENFPGAGVWTMGRTTVRNLHVRGNGHCGLVLNTDARVLDSTIVHNADCGVGLISGLVRGNHMAWNGTAQLRGANGTTLASGNVLIGTLPIDGGNTAGVISRSDNLCRAGTSGGGVSC